VLAVGATLWSLATLLTGFAPNVSAILLLRLMLGAAESTVFPAVSSLIATHVPLDKRGMANGIMSFGYQVGPAIGTFAGGILMAEYGWRPVFILFGAISLLWVLPWLRFSAGTSAAPAAARAAAPSYAQILRQRGLWGASLGHFSSNYNWYFILSFLPLYLVEQRGFSMTEMGLVAGSAYLINALAAVLGGWYMDRWVRAGRSRTVIYKFAMTSSHVVSIGAMVGMMLLPVREAIICLFVFEVFIGLCAPGTFGIGQILAGPLATGRWIGVQNFCGNTAGILAPALTGMMVAASGNYSMAFTVAALVNVLGVIGWGFILPKVEPIDWAAER
jgi:MFS family permease